jgi:hypothetical protein
MAMVINIGFFMVDCLTNYRVAFSIPLPTLPTSLPIPRTVPHPVLMAARKAVMRMRGVIRVSLFFIVLVGVLPGSEKVGLIWGRNPWGQTLPEAAVMALHARVPLECLPGSKLDRLMIDAKILRS